MSCKNIGCERTAGSWLLAFLFGGLAGAAAALIFTPKSGRQTRERIRDVAVGCKG